MLVFRRTSVLAFSAQVFLEQRNADALFLHFVVDGVEVFIVAGILAPISSVLEMGNAYAVRLQVRVDRIGIQGRACISALPSNHLELFDALAAALTVALPVLVVEVTFSASISYQLKTINAHASSLVVTSRLPM